MVTIITKKSGMTSDESKLAFAGGFLELAKAVQALLSDKNYLQDLGEQAAAANALNDREIEARDEAADIVLKSAQLRAEHDDREKALTKQAEDIEAQRKAMSDELDAKARQFHDELAERERQVGEKHAHADTVIEAANAKHVEASAVLSDAERQKKELDIREADLLRRERDIESFKSKITG